MDIQSVEKTARSGAMDIQSAEKAARSGAVAGFIVAGLSAALVTVAVFGEAGGFFENWNSPWSYLDSALVAGLSFGVLRRSRTSAVCLFLFYLLSQILFMVETGAPAGLLATLAFLYFFGRGIQGTFAYHRIYREQNPEPRPARKTMYFVWVPLGLVGVVLAGLMVLGSMGPPLAVVTGEELSPDDLRILLDEDIIEPGETVVLFYSAGLFSVREDGSLLTGTRVISYEEIDDGLWIGSAFFDEIASVSVEEPGGALHDTQVLVTLHNGRSFYLLISTEENGDKRFLKELEKAMG